MSKRMLAGLVICVVALGAVVVAAELKVEEAVICKAVVDRAPQEAGSSFPASVGKLFCFNRVVGGAEGTVIKHVWFQGDQQVDSIELKIGAANWRTWSSKTIDPSQKGAWKVEIQDAAGKVLSTLNFTIE